MKVADLDDGSLEYWAVQALMRKFRGRYASAGLAADIYEELVRALDPPYPPYCVAIEEGRLTVQLKAPDLRDQAIKDSIRALVRMEYGDEVPDNEEGHDAQRSHRSA